MSQKEEARLKVLNQVLERRLTVKEASHLMGLSERHGWRLLAGYRKEGAAAVAHGNRGRQPSHRVPEETRTRVRELAQGCYWGCNHCHLTELLAEREGTMLSRSTVRRIVTEAGIRSPRRRRPPKHRCRPGALWAGIPRRGCCYRLTVADTTGYRDADPGSPWWLP